MAILYDIIKSMEASSVDGAETPDSLDTFYKEYWEKAKDVRGRLYAMLKKLTSEGSVSTDAIKYLKTKCIFNPSQLVMDISLNIEVQIIFNDKVCKYEDKQLNHPISVKACENHVEAINKLEELYKVVQSTIKKDKKKLDNKDITEKEKKELQEAISNINKNYRMVFRHVLWSSRRLLTNVRIKPV